MADVIADTAEMVDLLEGVSDCKVIETKTSLVEYVSGSAVAGANIDAGATLKVRLDNNKLYGIHIPAIKADLVDTDGSLLTGSTAISDLYTAFSVSGHWLLSETNKASAIVPGSSLDL
jgi:hypothetical protein